MRNITQERITHFYYYDSIKGGLYHKFNTKKKKQDERAGYKHSRGYRHVCIDQEIYKEHILIWMFHNEFMPDGRQIDHINNIRDDNRIENLRLGDKNTNQYNRFKNKNNTSGFKGVFRHGKKWEMSIMSNRKRIRIGGFDSPENAAKVYNEKAIDLHGEFAKVNAI